MNEPTKDVTQRLDRLERENRRLNQVGAMVLVGLAAVGLVGCAAMAGSPPPPPLVEDALNGLREYRWKPFLWEPGAKLTYRVQYYIENPIDSWSAVRRIDAQFTLAEAQKTAKGLTRVNVLVDANELGFLLYDDAGRVQDVVVLRPEMAEDFKSALRTAQDPLEKHFASRAMIQNERYPIETPVGDLIDRIPLGFFEPKATVTYEFIGYKRMGRWRVAAIRTTTPNVIRQPIYEGEFRFDNLSWEVLNYIEPDRGFLVASYAVLTLGGEAQGKRAVVRFFSRWMLDESNSSGV